MKAEWTPDIRAQCRKSGVSFFFPQLAGGASVGEDAGSGDPAYRGGPVGRVPSGGLWPRDAVQVCSTAW